MTTAVGLLIVGILFAVSAVASRAGARLGFPIALSFIGLGMLAGSEGFGNLAFEDYGLTFRVGTVALVLILFDGGLNTPLHTFNSALKPAGVLATIGVVLTAGIVAIVAHWMGMGWTEAALLGAIVAPTDASAVFAVLRTSRMELSHRAASTLEVESGLNDPVAVILTMTIVSLLSGTGTAWTELLWKVPLEIAVGSVVGWFLGRFSAAVLLRLRLPVSGLYTVLTLGIAFMGFGLATVLHGSGYLAVYVLGVAMSHRGLPYDAGLRRIHDALAWFCQVAMFLMLGLLVFPSRLIEVAWIGLGLAFVLAVIARPIAVILCLLPFNYAWRERIFVAWVGLRGAVPIILATMPILAQTRSAYHIFDIVFFIVVASSVFPGSTVRWVMQKLQVGKPAEPEPPVGVELNAVRRLRGDILTFYINEHSALAGAAIQAIDFPPESAAMLIVRGSDMIAPKGPTKLKIGDHVYVFARAEDRERITTLFWTVK